MAKGSVRKKGKKWYYRFYVEDASGNMVQKECAGTESKSETEKLLRQAMEDYESKKFIAKADNITLGQLLDTWAEEELKTGTLSNGTVGTYLQAINRIKQHPVSRRKLKTVTSGHLQQFMDLLSFGGTVEDFVSKGYSIDYIRSYSAVLQQSFRFAVFPKQYITFNPMQYVVMRHKYLTVRRSVRYNGATHKHEIGSTKRKKVRTVDFGNALADILKKARKQQLKNRMQYGGLYHRNFYREVTEKNRVHYEYYNLPMTEDAPEDYTEISFVCLREDGCLELPATIETACRTAARKVPELEGFHFHTLRHTYTTNLLSNGAQPKDVQELLGHSDVSTTMNVYAHATREAKRDSAKLLDKVVGMN
ncbi:site-specific integrase [Clostridiaceae bacterium]|nr:site-specific integrase [Clostridiaceae bacterium]